MNFTLGIIIAVGVLVAISLVFIAIDPGYLSGIPVKPVAVEKPLQDGFTRMTSTQHPGIGHESHQSVSVLPLSEKVYSGTLHYLASEPIQLITLHGPLADGEAKGQATWTPDGITKYALTFVTPDNAQGEWKFAGNAVLIHTKKTEPFTVDYMVDYTEKEFSPLVTTGTLQSEQDPGIGHESHQLVMILEPSDDIYSGIISYSATEPIQLITLTGPLGPTERPVMAWTPDGQTLYALNLFDPANAMGSWEFSGNALAIHTRNTTQFTVSYSVSATAESKTPPVSAMPLAPTTHMISIPQGSGATGCETTNECFIPYQTEIYSGEPVVWINADSAAHTVTSGLPAFHDGLFDSGMIMPNQKWEYVFTESGQYDYHCMVHPWMTGKVIVE
ncbi:MAG: plastocyanin/azurin family copper-binding protein [Nitrosarchaeum sp.]